MRISPPLQGMQALELHWGMEGEELAHHLLGVVAPDPAAAQDRRHMLGAVVQIPDLAEDRLPLPFGHAPVRRDDVLGVVVVHVWI